MSRSREERLFGAACLKLALERRHAKPVETAIYSGALDDLGLSETDVDAYLARHRIEVERALDGRKTVPGKME